VALCGAQERERGGSMLRARQKGAEGLCLALEGLNLALEATEGRMVLCS